MVDFGERYLPHPMKVSEIRDMIVRLSKFDAQYNPTIKELDSIGGIFNFGTISKNFSDKLFEDAKKHAATKIGFIFPFPNFAFRCSHEENGEIVGKTYISLNFNVEGKSGDLMLRFTKKQNGAVQIFGGILKTNSTNPSLLDFRSINPDDTIENTKWVYHEVVDQIFMFSLVLATKNIPKTTETPSPKLQQKRAKEGLPPLPYTTNVKLNAYMIARNNTESGNTGTHASPRPHLRRAHLRTVVRGEETITIPVQQCMVNWDGGSPLMREEYKVKTTNLEK